MKTMVGLALSLVLFSPVGSPVVLAADAGGPADDEASTKSVAEPETFTSDHRLTISGHELDYTATAGTMLMINDDGEPVALFGYTAYVEKGADPAERPSVARSSTG